jgi:hypothetical protein
MTEAERDEAFEIYLKRRSVLPDAPSSDGQLESPAVLDAIVLRKAREAIEAQTAPAQREQQMLRAPRWAVPVALAATLMLCLSVVMNIALNTNRQRTMPALANGNVADERRDEVILPESKAVGSPPPHPPVVVEKAMGARQSDAAAAPRAAATTGRVPSAVEPSRSDVAGERDPSDPKNWLQRIDALRAAGQTGLADAEMRRFRAAFPGYAEKTPPPASSEPPK